MKEAWLWVALRRIDWVLRNVAFHCNFSIREFHSTERCISIDLVAGDRSFVAFVVGVGEESLKSRENEGR